MKAKSFNPLIAAYVLLLTLVTAASTYAGTITIVDLPATGTDASSDITNSKSYTCAVNFGTQAGTVPTNVIVGGVTFYHFGPVDNVITTTNAVDSIHGGRFVLSCGGPNANKLRTQNNPGQGAVASQADGNMQIVLSDQVFPGGVGNPGAWLQEEFDNLTPGTSYSLRIYYRYWGNTVGARLQNAYFTGEGYQQAYPNNPFDIDAGGAHYIKYDFVALTTNVFCIMSNTVPGGATIIEAATLEVDTNTYAPFIVPGRDASAAWAGVLAKFSVGVDGTSPLSFQWYSNSVNSYSGAAAVTDGNDYSGSTAPTLTATNNLLDYYFVIVTNNYGSVTSSIVQINPAPTIIAQPTSTNMGNTNVAYNAAASGFPPLGYQWYFNTSSNYSGATGASGSGYSGSTTASLQATTNLQDYYFLIVTNGYGSATSSITAYNPYPIIVAQAAPSIVGTTINFKVTANGWPTLGYQWYFNTTPDYAGASVSTDGGGVSGSTTTNVAVATLPNCYYYYFVVVNNYYGSITSSIVHAVDPLTVVAAGEPIWNQTSQTNVLITFSDGLDPVTAATVGNYSLDLGATISSATVVATNEVALVTSSLAGSYTLTISNVKDFLSGTMSPSSTNMAVGVYPAKIALWLRSDTNVTADASSNMITWGDISGNGNDLSTVSTIAPQFLTNSYGDPVVRFTAANSTEMSASSSSSLALTRDFSVIAVITKPTTAGTGTIVSKTGLTSKNQPAPYDYFITGTAGLVRGNGTSSGAVGTTLAITAGIPQIIAVSESGNTVTHFVNGNASAPTVLGGSFQETNCLDAGQSLNIGLRADNANKLTGDISELIMAGSAISSYDVVQLGNYLIAKHRIASSSRTNIVLSTSGGNLTLSWPSDHTGWRLQVQTNDLSAGLRTNWFDVSGSITTNQVIIPIGQTNGSVFYRMAYP